MGNTYLHVHETNKVKCFRKLQFDIFSNFIGINIPCELDKYSFSEAIVHISSNNSTD